MFEKIKNIFRRMFNKQKLLEETILKTEIKTNDLKINNFKEELEKNVEIYNTQKMYEEDKITERDLQISQIRKLINLYKEQINLLDREITIKKAKI